MQLGKLQVRRRGEQVVEPVARRMQLQAKAGVRRDERAPAAVLLHAQLAHLRARERGDEVLLVESEPEVVDAWELPLPRLDDDVDGAALELREAQLEAHAIEIVPAVAAFEGGRVLADPPVPRDQREAELADVACLDLAHLARDEVVMKEFHPDMIAHLAPNTNWTLDPPQIVPTLVIAAL